MLPITRLSTHPNKHNKQNIYTNTTQTSKSIQNKQIQNSQTQTTN